MLKKSALWDKIKQRPSWYSSLLQYLCSPPHGRSIFTANILYLHLVLGFFLSSFLSIFLTASFCVLKTEKFMGRWCEYCRAVVMSLSLSGPLGAPVSRPGHQSHLTHLFSLVFKPQLCTGMLLDCVCLVLYFPMIFFGLTSCGWTCLFLTSLFFLSPSKPPCFPLDLVLACSLPGFLSAWFSDLGSVTICFIHTKGLLPWGITLRNLACRDPYFLWFMCVLHSLCELFSLFIRITFKLCTGVHEQHCCIETWLWFITPLKVWK